MITRENDPEKKSGYTDEVDLIVVSDTIKRFFTWIWGQILDLLSIVKKRAFIITPFTLLGTAGGVVLFFYTPPTFVSTLTLSSKILTNEYCSDMISELEFIIKDNNPKLLAEKLKIDTISAKQIQLIEFYNYDEKLKDRLKDKDTVVLGLPFKVKVYATNNNVFNTLQNPLVDYLENNEYALKRRELKRNSLKLLQNRYEIEIAQLDSLKKALAENLLPRGTSSGFVFGQPLDPINIYREGVSFFQKKLDVSEELILINNIQIINGFYPRSKPDSPIIWKSIAKGLLSGMFLGLFLALLLEFRARMKKE